MAFVKKNHPLWKVAFAVSQPDYRSCRSICMGFFPCKQPEVYLYVYLEVICMEIQKHLNGYFFLQTTKIRRQRADVWPWRWSVQRIFNPENFSSLIFLWRWSASAILSVKQLWWNLQIQDFWIWECCSASVALQYWRSDYWKKDYPMNYNSTIMIDIRLWNMSLSSSKGDQPASSMITLFPRTVQNPYHYCSSVRFEDP